MTDRPATPSAAASGRPTPRLPHAALASATDRGTPGPARTRIRRYKRTATITLHWLLLVLVVPLGGGWITPFLEWSFALAALAMSALALVFGLQAHAGPKSPWIVRRINAWGHRGLHAYLAIVGALSLHGLVTGGGAEMMIHYQVLLWTTIFHAIYHLFRHLVVGDGALRTMTPRSIHRML